MNTQNQTSNISIFRKWGLRGQERIEDDYHYKYIRLYIKFIIYNLKVLIDKFKKTIMLDIRRIEDMLNIFLFLILMV